MAGTAATTALAAAMAGSVPLATAVVVPVPKVAASQPSVQRGARVMVKQEPDNADRLPVKQEVNVKMECKPRSSKRTASAAVLPGYAASEGNAGSSRSNSKHQQKRRVKRDNSIEARTAARMAAAAAVQKAKQFLEADRRSAEEEYAAAKKAAADKAVATRTRAMKGSGGEGCSFEDWVLALPKRERDKLISDLQLDENEKLHLIQAVRKYKQLVSQRTYLAKRKAKEKAKMDAAEAAVAAAK